MISQRFRALFAIVAIGMVWAWPVVAADEELPDSDVLMRALVDELSRAMELQMEDLEKPYFIQYDVDDEITWHLSAEYGAITGAERDRSRTFRSRVRAGSQELDNTNFVDSGSFFFRFGGSGSERKLPLDDDYLALRQAMWRATDEAYKDAVETLTKKKAYMKDKNIVDRPNDFSRADVLERVEATAVLHFDQAEWTDNLKRLSGHFKEYEQIQDSSVRLLVGAGNLYVVNSEGTRLRTPDAGALLIITAQVQAEDGMRFSNSRSYAGETTDDFPPLAELLKDIDALVAELTGAMQAPVIEHYSGPILFDGPAAGQMFQALLAGGLAGKPDPVGERRRPSGQGAESLESRLGTRILPKSFRVWDDPAVEKHNDEHLFGHYRYDGEGVPAERVDLVTNGKLANLCLSRAPTKKLSGSNGHGRRALQGGGPQAAIGCLFIADGNGVSDEELKSALIEAARDEGLDYGVRIKSIRSASLTSSRADLMSFFVRVRRGGGSTLGDPVIAYKVYVEDGREEPFRGCEFGPLDVTDLKRIAAAGDTPTVHNYIGLGMGGATPPSTIVAPPVLFEELELSEIRQEHDKRPILAAPLYR